MIPKKNRTGFISAHDAIIDYDLDLKNQGYDYSNNLMNKTMSPYLMGNKNVNNFLTNHIQKIMVLLINNVKKLRIYYNIAVPKNYNKIN